MDNVELFAKIQELVKKEARQEATNVYNELGTKYSVAQVPTHSHNGIDSNPINQADIVGNSKYGAGYGATAGESPKMRTFSNPTRLCFYGVATNGSGTKIAKINGEVAIGRSYIFDGIADVNTVTPTAGTQFVQTCNFVYIDNTSLTNTKMGTQGNYIAYVNDGVNILVSMKVTSIEKGFIYFTTTVASGWEITGNFLLS